MAHWIAQYIKLGNISSVEYLFPLKFSLMVLFHLKIYILSLIKDNGVSLKKLLHLGTGILVLVDS